MSGPRSSGTASAGRSSAAAGSTFEGRTCARPSAPVRRSSPRAEYPAVGCGHGPTPQWHGSSSRGNHRGGRRRRTAVLARRGEAMARTRTVRRLVVVGITAVLVLAPVGSAFACGALLAPNGTISLTRTTTLAAYHNGVEHYI